MRVRRLHAERCAASRFLAPPLPLAYDAKHVILEGLPRTDPMSAAPKDLYYTAAHAWLQMEDDHIARIGITDFAQSELGDVVHVELPDVANIVSAGEEIVVVESVKTASDVPTPVSGVIVAVNDALRASPELVNSSPYDKGWIFRIRISNKGELADLLDAGNYVDNYAG